MAGKNADREAAFEMAASSIRFGAGVRREVGKDLADRGVRRALVFADPNLANQPQVTDILESLDDEGVAYTVYDRVSIEPTEASFQDAIAFANETEGEAFVAVGGGSTIDTAKAANLYSTYPADFLDYVNPPIGKGLPVPGELKPLIAIPTTAGTGSETTGVAVFDFSALTAKTGIAHRRLKPTLGLIDPDNTKTLPREVAIATGLDVLSHAIESYTTIPYTDRPRPERPVLRPAYQGRNPISDLWALESLRMVAEFLPRAAADAGDDEARGQMLLAAAYAGIGFGNAGVHLPHGMSYPVSSRVREYDHPGYKAKKPLVPHGISVILNAPAVFRFTAPACPERHLNAAGVLGAKTDGAQLDDAGTILSGRLIELMQELDVPSGLSAVGYSRADIPDLVGGTMPQHRVTKLSPVPAGEDELASLFEDALKYW